MPNPEIGTPGVTHFIALALVLTLLIQSIAAWVEVLRARIQGRAWLDWSDEPRAKWTSFAEITVLILVFLMLFQMLGQHLADFLDPPTDPPEPFSVSHLGAYLITSIGLAAILPAILVSSGRPMSEFGIRLRQIQNQLRDGGKGFLLAVAPTALITVITAPLRTRENQNSLLILLSETTSPMTIVMISVAAVIIAPLYEEMMFRVVLQGWLSSRLPAQSAVVITAVAFAAIHGLVDGIALLPLALVLGGVFHDRHSYLSVLVIHGLFNATMLTLSFLIRA